MLKYSPSLLVASAIAISNLVTKERECWSEMLAHHCKYTLEVSRFIITIITIIIIIIISLTLPLPCAGPDVLGACL